MRKLAIILIFISFLVYNLNLNRVNKGDTTPARLLAITTLLGRGIYLDDFQKNFPPEPFFVKKFNGHYISTYPMIPGIMALPIYLPFYIYFRLTHQANLDNLYNISFDLERLTASIYTAISVGLLFVLAFKTFKDEKLSILLALIFAFATPTFSISSQQLWQHGIANLFIITSLIFLIDGLHLKRKKYYLISLAFGILAFLTRNVFVFYLLGILILSVRSDRKNTRIYLLVVGIAVLFYILMNLYLYGVLAGTEAAPISAFKLTGALEGFLGILFSPGRGMLFYTPIFFLSLLSILRFYKQKWDSINKRLFIFSYLITIILIVFYSIWGRWWAGATWGDRYLSDISVPAVILLGYFYTLSKNKLSLGAFYVLAGYSFVIQLIGGFYYPRGHFDDYPADIDLSTTRVWNLADNPISRNLLVGPDLSRIYELYYSVNNIKPHIYRNSERECEIRKTGESQILGNRILDLELINKSDVNWITSGNYPLEVRQLYFQERRLVAQSPVPSTTLPPIIKAGESVRMRIVLILPDAGNYNVSISPVQEKVNGYGDSWWTQNCRVSVTLN